MLLLLTVFQKTNEAAYLMEISDGHLSRWLNTTDSVNTDQSDGMERERWRNGNVTYSVNRPINCIEMDSLSKNATAGQTWSFSEQRELIHVEDSNFRVFWCVASGRLVGRCRTFRKIVVPPSSGSSHPRRMARRHGVTHQKTWISSVSAARTINICQLLLRC
jgi:hypothetical protein